MAERQEIFKNFSRYLAEEPVFEGEYYRVKIENDYYVSRRLYNGGEYFAITESIWHLDDGAYIPSTFVPFGYVWASDSIERVLEELKNATASDIDWYAEQIKWWMEVAQTDYSDA